MSKSLMFVLALALGANAQSYSFVNGRDSSSVVYQSTTNDAQGCVDVLRRRGLKAGHWSPMRGECSSLPVSPVNPGFLVIARGAYKPVSYVPNFGSISQKMTVPIDYPQDAVRDKASQCDAMFYQGNGFNCMKFRDAPGSLLFAEA